MRGNQSGGNNRGGNNRGRFRQNDNLNRDNRGGGNLIKLSVTGWAHTEAAKNNDGGVSSLCSFLERKSHRKLMKFSRNNDSFDIWVLPEDLDQFLRLRGYIFAKSPISIEQITGSANHTTPQNEHRNHIDYNQTNHNQVNGRKVGRNEDSMRPEVAMAGADQVEEALVKCIQRCYEPGAKFLNLGNLHQAPEILGIGLQSQSASKVFSAVFVCCETKVFETPLKRQQMVESLSLAQNGLKSVKDCISAAGTFNHIKNLDLSNNLIEDVGELRYWRNRFPNLEHLILSGNPVDNDPQTQKKMKQWYSKLKFYNGQELATTPADDPLKPPMIKAAVELLPNDPHPEIAPDSKYGQPEEGKPTDLLMKQQMALRFSYETKLRLGPTEQCLLGNNFDYNKALQDLQNLVNNGMIQDSMLWSPRS